MEMVCGVGLFHVEVSSGTIITVLCLVSLKLFFISLGDSYCNNISMAYNIISIISISVYY